MPASCSLNCAHFLRVTPPPPALQCPVKDSCSEYAIMAMGAAETGPGTFILSSRCSFPFQALPGLRSLCFLSLILCATFSLESGAGPPAFPSEEVRAAVRGREARWYLVTETDPQGARRPLLATASSCFQSSGPARCLGCHSGRALWSGGASSVAPGGGGGCPQHV